MLNSTIVAGAVCQIIDGNVENQTKETYLVEFVNFLTYLIFFIDRNFPNTANSNAVQHDLKEEWKQKIELRYQKSPAKCGSEVQILRLFFHLCSPLSHALVLHGLNSASVPSFPSVFMFTDCKAY